MGISTGDVCILVSAFLHDKQGHANNSDVQLAVENRGVAHYIAAKILTPSDNYDVSVRRGLSNLPTSALLD